MNDFESYAEELAEAMNSMAKRTGDIANAIYPLGSAIGGHDANGGYVTSLTEAVMGVSAGLVKIASAIDGLASAIEDKNDIGDSIAGLTAMLSEKLTRW